LRRSIMRYWHLNFWKNCDNMAEFTCIDFGQRMK